MKSLRSVTVAVVSVLLVALAPVAVPALAAPAAQSGNLLANPGFEDEEYTFNGDETLRIPTGWVPWWNPSLDRPLGYNPSSPARAHSGAKAASYWTQYRGYDAGLYQRVAATPGTIYRFSIWVHTWSTTDRDVTTSDTNVRVSIGIDPNGGEDWSSGSIVWSGEVLAPDTYQQLTIEATAAADHITVFVRSRPDFPVEQSDTYWDDAELVSVGQGAPPPDATQAATQAPTQPPSSGVPVGSIPRSTPAPDGSVVHIVSPGETLIGIAVTYEVSLDQIRQLNNLTSDVIYVGQRLIIQPAQGAQPEPTAEPTAEGGEGEAVAEAPPEEEQPAEAPEAAEAEASGTICVMSYEDANGNGLREPDEPALAGFTFAVSDGTQTVGTYITDDSGTSYCFTDLPSGTYIVSWVADNYTPTTDQTWAVSLAPGATVSREFGAQLAGEASAEEGTEGSARGGLPTWVIALVAALGVILLLGGLSVAGYFLLIRPRQQI